MLDIRHGITEEIAKKIFGNQDNAVAFLKALANERQLSELQKASRSALRKEAFSLVVRHWEYEASIPIIRDLFRQTPKYQRGKESETAISNLIEEWHRLNLGQIEWPCSQGAFDEFVQRVNSESLLGIEKDEKVKLAAVKYRRLKELNTARNDYLETLIFEKNERIVPTLDHRRGVDFFIDGISYDQKVAKSPTNEFKRDFGENWKEVAKQNPHVVAEYLYKYQDEGRFDASPRLYVVYLDEDIPIHDLKRKIDAINLSEPFEVSFDYQHKSLGIIRHYQTKCFVLLLSKD